MAASASINGFTATAITDDHDTVTSFTITGPTGTELGSIEVGHCEPECCGGMLMWDVECNHCGPLACSGSGPIDADLTAVEALYVWQAHIGSHYPLPGEASTANTQLPHAPEAVQVEQIDYPFSLSPNSQRSTGGLGFHL